MSEERKEIKNENIAGITLRVAIFFGLTTFTLCIAIFYIDSILEDTRELVGQKDSVIQALNKDLAEQEMMIRENEHQIDLLKGQVNKGEAEAEAAE